MQKENMQKEGYTYIEPHHDMDGNQVPGHYIKTSDIKNINKNSSYERIDPLTGKQHTKRDQNPATITANSNN